MRKKGNYSFFQNTQCEYFPCHKTEHPEDFNCLFCYCPLYALGRKCGGNFKYNEKGIKDCSSCLVPHRRGNYDLINSRFKEIMEIANINQNTLKYHNKNIYSKLGVTSRKQLLEFAALMRHHREKTV